MVNRAIPILSAVTLGCVLASCQTSPLGRKQFIMVSDAQMDQMGAEAFQETKLQTPPDTNLVVVNYVNCVVSPLVQAAQGQTGIRQWDVQVFKSKQVNAFALPGGHIGVYEGLLPVAKTDGQLAAVLGH